MHTAAAERNLSKTPFEMTAAAARRQGGQLTQSVYFVSLHITHGSRRASPSPCHLSSIGPKMCMDAPFAPKIKLLMRVLYTFKVQKQKVFVINFAVIWQPHQPTEPA
jgi:hypothetical protein